MITKKENLAYLAGILDGEGWFSIYRTVSWKSKRHTPTYMPSVGVANTDKRLIDWLINNYGGKARERKPNKKAYGWKNRYEWRLNKKEATYLIPLVIPYLLLKRRRAEILLELNDLHSVKYRGRGVPDGVLQEREKLYQELRALNGTRHQIKPLASRNE